MNSPVAWVLVAHIVGLVFWIGGLLVATQVLASETVEPSVEARHALSRLESKLLKGIAHPGAALTVIAGIVILALQPSYLHEGWLHAKLTLVAILIALDLTVTFRARAFEAGRIQMKRRTPKLQHSAISLVFLLILILVLIKPVELWALAVPVLAGVLGLIVSLLPG